MILQPLQIQCPSCGSGDITYTCEPKCCFNHICGACYTTFELATQPQGGMLNGICAPSFERDCLAPTVACVRCGSLDVFTVVGTETSTGQLVCTACHHLLHLVFDAVERR